MLLSHWGDVLETKDEREVIHVTAGGGKSD